MNLSKQKLHVLIVDASEGGLLGLSWKLGAKIFRSCFHDVHLVKTPDEFVRVLGRYAKGSIATLQIWGHGKSGRPLIQSTSIGPYLREWEAVEGGSIWFRSCYVMKGADGQAFAATLASRYNVHVFGHLAIIGPWAAQSHLVGLAPGETPWWPASLAPPPSAPWHPRTVMALQMTLPPWAFTKDGL